MKIVLEGPDGCGKSTIAEIVAKCLGVPLRGRILRKGPDAVEEANREDLSIATDCVFDRCYWVSDLVYEPIYNGKLSVFAGDAQAQKIWMQEQDIMLVYIRCTETDIDKRISVRGDDLYSLEQIKDALGRYEEFMVDQKLADLIIDNSGSRKVEDAAAELIYKIRHTGRN
jgi:thymidylate kinase